MVHRGISRERSAVIVADANVFLRMLAEPATPQDRVAHSIVRELFDRVAAGGVRLLTPDAVIAEVVFIMSNPRHYAIPRDTVVSSLLPLLTPPGCVLANRDAVLAALDLWEANPRISFPDALVTAWAWDQRAELATFDRRLQRVAGDAVWPPCLPAGAAG